MRHDTALTIEEVHKNGACRHPEVWFTVNEAAVEVLWSSDLIPVSSRAAKEMVPRILLHVLDRMQGKSNLPMARVESQPAGEPDAH